MSAADMQSISGTHTCAGQSRPKSEDCCFRAVVDTDTSDIWPTSPFPPAEDVARHLSAQCPVSHCTARAFLSSNDRQL